MAEFLVECYVPQSEVGGIQARAERSALAAEELTRAGTPVRYVRSIFVPGDETCFHLYEAASAELVREAAQRAAITFERIETIAELNGGGR